jgi:hypothetical protein
MRMSFHELDDSYAMDSRPSPVSPRRSQLDLTKTKKLSLLSINNKSQNSLLAGSPTSTLSSGSHLVDTGIATSTMPLMVVAEDQASDEAGTHKTESARSSNVESGPLQPRTSTESSIDKDLPRSISRNSLGSKGFIKAVKIRDSTSLLTSAIHRRSSTFQEPLDEDDEIASSSQLAAAQVEEEEDSSEEPLVSWYLSDATRDEIRALKQCPVGSFLVHDSHTQEGNFCISVWNGESIYTGLIVQTNEGFAFENTTVYYASLRKLVLYYTIKPCPGCKCCLYIDPIKEAALQATNAPATEESTPPQSGKSVDQTEEQDSTRFIRILANDISLSDLRLMALPTHSKDRVNISSEISSFELRKAGWLLKSSSSRTMRKRWFVLQDTMFKVSRLKMVFFTFLELTWSGF